MTGAEWQYSLQLYIVGILYSGAWNASDWETPQTVEVDDCGPANLISPGSVLWLALVPAVACVVQLPGSVFLPGRSNFYRFAPEAGLADCFGTVSLLAGALWRGYRWRESVAAVLMVREGIGEGDLWWREGAAEGRGPPPRGEEADDTAIEDAASRRGAYETYRARARLRPYSEPISVERMIGALLFAVALIKTIATLATSSGHPAVLVPSLVALSYSASFLVLEALVWSLAPVLQSYSLEDIPPQNLLELLRFVDPGDNPFVSADATRQTSTRQGSNGELELGPLGLSSPPSPPGLLPWNRAVAAFVLLFVLFGAFLWCLILMATWNANKGVFVVAVGAVGIVGLRLAEKASVLLWHYSLARSVLPPAESWARSVLGRPSSRAARLDRRLAGDPKWFLLKWLLDRITIVNLFSGAWVAVICLYCILLFPRYDLDGLEEQLTRPQWLDWLG